MFWIAISLANVVVLLAAFKAGSWRGAATSPVVVLGATWIPLLVMGSSVTILSPPVGVSTVWFFLTGLLAMAVGASVGSVLGRRHGPATGGRHTFQPHSLAKLHVALTCLLSGYVSLEINRALPVIRSLGGFNAMWTTTGSQFRLAQRTARIQEVASGSNLALSVAGYILFVGMGALITAGILLAMRRYVAALIPLIVLLAYSIVTLERTTFLLGAALMLFSWWLFSEAAGLPRFSLKRARVSRVVWAALGALVLAVALLVPLAIRNRNSSNSTGSNSLAEYAFGGVGGLNLRMPEHGGWIWPVDSMQGVVGDRPGLGAYTLYSWFDLLRRAGFDVPVAPISGDFYTITVLGRPANTNIATLFADFYNDFGTAGVIAGAGALGLIASILRRRIAQGDAWAVPPLAVLLAAIAWSFFGNAVLTDIRFAIMSTVMSVILWRLSLSRPTEAPAVMPVAETNEAPRRRGHLDGGSSTSSSRRHRSEMWNSR